MRETREPLDLLGTITGAEGLRRGILKNRRTKTVRALRIGQEWGALRLESVRPEEVRIWNEKTERVERVSLSRSSGIRSGSGGGNNERRTVSRYQINQAIHQDMNRLLASVDAAPRLVGDRIEGFVLRGFRGEAGRLIRRLGFREGDVITRVNGRTVDSMERALSLWAQLQHRKRFRITIERDGEERQFQYELAR